MSIECSKMQVKLILLLKRFVNLREKIQICPGVMTLGWVLTPSNNIMCNYEDKHLLAHTGSAHKIAKSSESQTNIFS